MYAEAFDVVRSVITEAMPYVIAFALCGKVADIMLKAMFKGKLKI